MNEYRDTFASLIKFCQDFATDMTGSGINLKVLNLDAANDPQTWPNQDVIGLAEFDFELDDGIIQIDLMFVVSTIEDTNNFRLNDILNSLINRLLPGQRIKMVNATTGNARGFLNVQNGTRVAPPMSANTRALQPVMVSLLSDQILRA